jgi:signal recognition particle receptor subunit beta
MVSINYAFKEIISKIVYYGPGLSGKTTNLQYVFKKVPSETRGELISLATDADRTLYFDFLPVNVGNIQGFATKFQLYTVPGQVYYNATRKLVLRGVDGLVFVADSQVAKMDENVESLQNLSDNLEEYGYDITQLPLVLQYNKRDLPDIASIAELERALNPRGVPYFEAVASTGDGVFKTLKAISKMVLDQVRAKRMEPARIIAPQPAEEPVIIGAPSKPSPIVEKPVKQHAAEISPAVELSNEPVHTFDKIGTRKVERVIIGENDIPANVVVSDTPVEKKSYHEQEKDDFEETTERAVFKTEPLESESKTQVPEEMKITNDYCEVENKPQSEIGDHYYNPSFGEETSIRDDEMPEFNMNSSLPLAKPQMAESRKVKNKKSKFNIMGWFKKSKS